MCVYLVIRSGTGFSRGVQKPNKFVGQSVNEEVPESESVRDSQRQVWRKRGA